MRYTLTYDGVPIGFVELEGAPRAVGSLYPLSAFEACGLRSTARRLGVALTLLGWKRAPRPASARALAGALAQAAEVEARLGLVDARGASAAIWRITAIEFPRHPPPVVVAMLRDQAVPRGAVAPPIVAGPGAGAHAA
ncbi:MAG TPA: hypothetical protein VLD67_16705 [Vicinamibacterales bacterium]|nr:hypothetical protein [Gemmatimonadaceae bacterium]HSC28919.1 hypothetical protein [Vicinamibacterales bacterium]